MMTLLDVLHVVEWTIGFVLIVFFAVVGLVIADIRRGSRDTSEQ